MLVDVPKKEDQIAMNCSDSENSIYIVSANEWMGTMDTWAMY
jgi:hypothetical protein